MNATIVVCTIENKQDVVNYLTLGIHVLSIVGNHQYAEQKQHYVMKITKLIIGINNTTPQSNDQDQDRV